jgi:pimeloyl-ACP methyl ester carboxylesterase
MNTSSAEPPAPAGRGPESSSHHARRGLSRRAFVGGAAAATGVSLVDGWASSAASAAGPAKPVPDGFGSVSTAPRLPAGFTKTFKSRFVQAGGIRQHVVIGGDGPPLLLVHGWPQNWYAWRKVMPALARDFTVIAVDQRGIGLTEKPRDGYDTATLARDLVALMDALGHRRFAAVGHDTGLIIGYALAADHPQRVARVALAEVPGPPGALPSPPLFVPDALNNRLWHRRPERGHPGRRPLGRRAGSPGGAGGADQVPGSVPCSRRLPLARLNDGSGGWGMPRLVRAARSGA